MFDIGASELLVIVVVAILVIGPKDMPRAMRTAGRWIGKVRRVSGHFRSGIDAMIREAELEEMEKEWKAQNARIMAETGAHGMSEEEKGILPDESVAMEPLPPAADREPHDLVPPETNADDEPSLPLEPPAKPRN